MYVKKYPISVHNKQCIGPCYEPDTFITHPITLNRVTVKNNPFCPTDIWKSNDSKVRDVDLCYVPTKNIDVQTTMMNIIIPEIKFGGEDFLKIYYNIYSFENGLEKIEENDYPYYTKMRILECMWSAYGNNLNILSNRLVFVYENIIKKKWIYYFYGNLKKYVNVTKNQTIHFSNNTNESNNKIEIVNFLIKKLITPNNIYKVLEMHINKNKNDWDLAQSHNNEIKIRMTKYFEDKILESI